MRILIVIALMLAPGLSFARTDCHVAEHPDHFEAVCIGDEKASPAPDTPAAAAIQHGEPLQQAATEQMGASVPSETVPAAKPQTAAASVPSSQTSQTQLSQGAVVHRQGRQQFQKGMEDARANRLRLISDLQ
jgi:hypothetical protein